MSSRFFIFGGLFLLIFAGVAPASATFLTIEGKSALKVAAQSEGLRLFGSYQLSNLGDEDAFDVRPEFQFGNWRWIGSAERLEKGAAYKWTIDEIIPESSLPSGREDGKKIAHGKFPLFILRRYRDVNGYDFSTPEVVALSVGQDDDDTSSVQIKVQLEDCRESFDGVVQVLNAALVGQTIRLSVFTSREINALLERTLIEMKSGESVAINLRGRNISAVSNSSYAVYVIASWKGESGEAQMSEGVSLLRIKESNRNLRYLVALLLACLVPSGLLCFHLYRGKGGQKAEPGGRPR